MLKTLRVLCLFGLFIPGICQATEQRTVSVKGFASVETPPDIVHISIGVDSRAPQATAALDSTSASARQVIHYAKQFGVSSADIGTTSITLMQSFKYRNENGRSVQEPDGYSAGNTVEINLRNLTSMGVFLREVVNQGATRISNIQFKVADPKNISDDLKKNAFQNAKHQAEIFAESAGAKLGSVLSIAYPPRVTYSAGDHFFAADMPSRRPSSQVPIEAGLVTLQIDVDVTWTLE
jgi:uncharacterized protein YggE